MNRGKNPIPTFAARAKRVATLRPKLIRAAKQKNGHCIVFDSKEVKENYKRFTEAFKKAGVPIRPFYALKSNSYPKLLKSVTDCGGGLDVSSPRELMLALKANAKEIVYTGPGKTEAAFKKILGVKGAKVIIHLDSLTELRTLSKLVKGRKSPVVCGVRVVPSSHESWAKFGIPLQDLKGFLAEAAKSPSISIEGVQFHISYVKNAKPFCKALSEIATYAERYLTRAQRASLKFIDIGGGFYPEVFEGEYPWNKEGLLFYDEPGLLERILNDEFHPRAKSIDVSSIEDTAREIARLWNRKIKKVLPHVSLLAEPGRFFSFSAMHYLFYVVDKKTPQSCIVDAGWNSVGWERYQYLHYVPIFNLTRFKPENEKPFLVYGNLCLPDDIWGYYVRGDGLEIGDLLCMPFQGAYTFTYVQDFIRGIPPVVDI